jgi:hypothetical protein
MANIRIEESTKKDLEDLGKKSDTFDTIIKRLLTEHKAKKKGA